MGVIIKEKEDLGPLFLWTKVFDQNNKDTWGTPALIVKSSSRCVNVFSSCNPEAPQAN